MQTTTRRIAGVAGLLAVLALAAGCSSGPATGDVTGTVTVDGKTPPSGSSITFIPTDGKSPTAGSLIEEGKYTARVPVGTAKVEIRVPRVIGKSKAREGPGAGGDLVEESLPARYNDNTELKLDVKSGRNEKNWDLKSK
ncbi:MAG: hypothetical protein L0Z62_40205 [Gemmataceae bacterium]|nr:hypothetical protein [Gemmataceae bacterium]